LMGRPAAAQCTDATYDSYDYLVKPLPQQRGRVCSRASSSMERDTQHLSPVREPTRPSLHRLHQSSNSSHTAATRSAPQQLPAGRAMHRSFLATEPNSNERTGPTVAPVSPTSKPSPGGLCDGYHLCGCPLRQGPGGSTQGMALPDLH
jgi:hypothetical protein